MRVTDGPLTVLVVDDQEAVRTLLVRLLADMNVACRTAATAAEALYAIDTDHVDIVFLDIALPDQNGLEIAALLHARSARLPVVMVTGNSTGGAALTALKEGAVDYVVKPFTRQQVANALRRARLKLETERQLTRLRELERSCEERRADMSEVAGLLETTIQGSIDALFAALKQRDSALGDHSARVADVSGRIGKALGLSVEDRLLLHRAALVHDVGKWCIPEHVLLKQGPLTPPETELVRRHATIGYEILRTVPGLDAVARVVWAHQERFDGSGYPRRLSGAAIPFCARIISVSDAFDAITSDRPYRPRRSPLEAVQEIARCSGTQFDPAVAAALNRAIPTDWHPAAAVAMRSAGAGGR